MYTSRVSLCIGIVGVHPSYPSSPVGFYKPIMDISTPGSMYHHSWDFFSLQPRPCGKCVLEPIAILYSALANDSVLMMGTNLWGLRDFSGKTQHLQNCSVLLLGSKRFHWAYAQLLGCWRWSRHLSSIDCIVGPCDTLPLKYGRTLRLGAVNLFLFFSDSEIPTITHVVPKTNVDIRSS